MNEQLTTKADEVRTFLANYSRELEREGFNLNSVHFKRDAGRLSVRLAYETKNINNN